MFDEDPTLGTHDHEWHGSGNYELPQFQNLDADQFEKENAVWNPQTTDFTCAIVSQQMILKQFGIEVSEAQLVYEATSGGFLTSEGSAMEDCGRLLESHGVATHQSFGVEGLIRELSQGHKVIVGVDSGELWGTDSSIEDYFNGGQADHALVVNGLDLSDPNNPQAVLNDPGHPNGAGVRVPLDQFLDAWSDSGQFYVATDEAPPNLASDPLIGSGFRADSGMYMDTSYWDRFAETRGILFGQLIQNVDDVSVRLMTDGTAGDAYIGAVVKSVTGTIREMTNDQRNELLREI
jgi:hypothetical protein